MAFIDEQLVHFKQLIEGAILERGAEGKKSMICSSAPINLIHDAVKHELLEQGVARENIFPRFGERRGEIKLAGLLKQKSQDVCAVPAAVSKQPRTIDWGPLAFQNKRDPYGGDYSTRTLVINVRSQMSSVGKNSDTLFERTFAEALNLHMQYPEIVLGEVYLVPAYPYDDDAVARQQIAFTDHHIDIERYISFFKSIDGRTPGDPAYMYERCALLVVDFRPACPHLFRSSGELRSAGLISPQFPDDYESLRFDTFAEDLLRIYAQRYDISHLKQ